ncbi:MAG: hypothetical protein ACOC2U_03380 [bacterium]
MYITKSDLLEMIERVVNDDSIIDIEMAMTESKNYSLYGRETREAIVPKYNETGEITIRYENMGD